MLVGDKDTAPASSEGRTLGASGTDIVYLTFPEIPTKVLSSLTPI